MGTSLLGLTPANTYPALIKVGDNNGITSTLKTLSDGSGTNLPMQVSTTGVNFTGTVTGIPSAVSGVAGAIQFSDGSAFSSDATKFFWDNTNKRLGVGTNSPSSKIAIVDDSLVQAIFGIKTSQSPSTFQIFNSNSATTPVYNVGISDLDTRFIMFDSIYFRVNGTQIAELTASEFRLGGATGARLGIKGSGSTSATTSLLVQNSGGTQTFKVADDGVVTTSTLLINNTLSFNSADYGSLGLFAAGVWNFNGGGINNTPRINWGGYTSSFPSLKRNGTAIDVRLADDSNYAGFNTGATTIKGSGTTSATSSLIVGNNAGTTALEVLDDSRVKLGNSSDFTVYSGAGVVSRFAMNIGSTSLPTAQLQVKSSGTTAATTSLLVQNSAGTAALTIKDDLSAIFGSGLTTKGDLLFQRSDGSEVMSFYNAPFALDFGSSLSRVRFQAQTVSIGGLPNASAALTIDSTTRGFLPPQMTTTQKNAISSPAAGLVVYDSTTNKLCCYNGSTWNDLF